MRIIDTHLHIVDRSRFRYPWLDDVPSLNRDWTLASYAAEASRVGISTSMFMEVDVAQDDQLAEAAWAARLPAPVAGVIAACRPESTRFAADLDRLIQIPGLRGLRRILHSSPDEMGLIPLFVDNLRRVARHRLTFELCVLARQLPIAAGIAKACPDVSFMLDHVGVPDVRAQALDPWRGEMAALAAHPNVACKISGLVAYADPDGWSVDDLRPFVEHAIAVFGWDRVVWGSDWPVCTRTADLTRWVTATHQLLSGASEQEKAKLWHANALRIYRLS